MAGGKAKLRQVKIRRGEYDALSDYHKKEVDRRDKAGRWGGWGGLIGSGVGLLGAAALAPVTGGASLLGASMVAGAGAGLGAYGGSALGRQWAGGREAQAHKVGSYEGAAGERKQFSNKAMDKYRDELQTYQADASRQQKTFAVNSAIRGLATPLTMGAGKWNAMGDVGRGLAHPGQWGGAGGAFDYANEMGLSKMQGIQDLGASYRIPGGQAPGLASRAGSALGKGYQGLKSAVTNTATNAGVGPYMNVPVGPDMTSDNIAYMQNVRNQDFHIDPRSYAGLQTRNRNTMTNQANTMANQVMDPARPLISNRFVNSINAAKNEQTLGTANAGNVPAANPGDLLQGAIDNRAQASASSLNVALNPAGDQVNRSADDIFNAGAFTSSDGKGFYNPQADEQAIATGKLNDMPPSPWASSNVLQNLGWDSLVDPKKITKEQLAQWDIGFGQNMRDSGYFKSLGLKEATPENRYYNWYGQQN